MISLSNFLLERIDYHHVASELVKHYGLKSKVKFVKSRLKGDYNVDKDIINLRPKYKTIKDFLITVLHEIDHALDAKKFGKQKYKDKYELEMNKAVARGGDAHDDNYYEKKAEKFGRKMAKDYLKINRKNIY